MMNHDLADFESASNGGAEGGGSYQARTCGVCGVEYPTVRDHCPNCGHNRNKGASGDGESRNEPAEIPYADDIRVRNPSTRGVGFLVDAPTDDLARRFAAIAMDRLKTVNDVSEEKSGISTPTVNLMEEADYSILKPWGDLSTVPGTVPVESGDSEIFKSLIEEVDWDAREPTTYLYTEYGEPLVDRDVLEEYMESHDPSWLVPAVATSSTHTVRDRILERDRWCGYCKERTAQVYVGRDGTPSEFVVDPDHAAPIWECSTCGNYHLGGEIDVETSDGERFHSREVLSSETFAH